MATDDRTQMIGTATTVRPFRLHRLTECANLTCFNRSSEGQFGAVTLSSPSNRHRPVTLLLCIPCAEAVSAVVQ